MPKISLDILPILKRMGISLYIFQQHLDHLLVETEGKRIQHKVEKDNETGEYT
ncbi:hypothetical protein [Paenibacillus sp. FSL R5-0378]|uniref:hypothetical protein n=1 Tax=Paenibacillus sp. FSL R5-0378 TaxID=2921637 RepID=UPI0026D503B8